MCVRIDRLGNPIDPTASYARGTSLAGELAVVGYGAG